MCEYIDQFWPWLSGSISQILFPLHLKEKSCQLTSLHCKYDERGAQNPGSVIPDQVSFQPFVLVIASIVPAHYAMFNYQLYFILLIKSSDVPY